MQELPLQLPVHKNDFTGVGKQISFRINSFIFGENRYVAYADSKEFAADNLLPYEKETGYPRFPTIIKGVGFNNGIYQSYTRRNRTHKRT